MYRQIGAGIFGHTQNVGYVAKSGAVGPIFGAMGTEFQGEADSGIRFAPKCDFHTNIQKLWYSGWKRKRPATWSEQLEMSWFLADFVENGAEKPILASICLLKNLLVLCFKIQNPKKQFLTKLFLWAHRWKQFWNFGKQFWNLGNSLEKPILKQFGKNVGGPKSTQGIMGPLGLPTLIKTEYSRTQTAGETCRQTTGPLTKHAGKPPDPWATFWDGPSS